MDRKTKPLYVLLDKDTVVSQIARCRAETEVAPLQERLSVFEALVKEAPVSHAHLPDGDGRVSVRRDVLLEDLAQIRAARTVRRAHYYLDRLGRAVCEVRTGAVNDINLNRWKEYDEVLTDSLWIVDRRDTSGAHEAWYWGNFIPQIPHQLLLRYTRAGEWVLDPFAGSGTTLIECRRLGRNGMGVELNPDVVTRASEAVAAEPNPHGVTTLISPGDSTAVDFRALLAAHGVDRVHFVILHPPYHDIIRFSDCADDLSTASTLETFVARFAEVVARALHALEPGRYFAVVIGDKYQDGAWIPLGFYTMQAVMALGATLKSVVVKNFEGTRGKREQQALWRYRALAGGFYVFKHEYIFVFQAPPDVP
mgnify:CR=1 FL=1